MKGRCSRAHSMGQLTRQASANCTYGAAVLCTTGRHGCLLHARSAVCHKKFFFHTSKACVPLSRPTTKSGAASSCVLNLGPQGLKPFHVSAPIGPPVAQLSAASDVLRLHPLRIQPPLLTLLRLPPLTLLQLLTSLQLLLLALIRQALLTLLQSLPLGL